MSVNRRLAGLAITALAAFAGLLTLCGPARAGAPTVLTFDDLGAPAGSYVILNSQYSSLGVTFNDVYAIDYSQPPFGAGFAHSGTVGIEHCFAAEFCSTPITASFTAGQQRVKVWVGYSYPLSQPLVVRLAAFDAGHASLGIAEVALPASVSPTPIQTPLEVSVSGSTIRSVEISVPGGYTSGLAVDDLELSSAGPPPPCNATSVPTVQLLQPAGDMVVQHNEFLLAGTVDNGGAPIESATIIDNSQQGTPRTATLYPSLIDADGGAFGPIRLNGLLTPGGNKLTVTATNCLGTGADGNANVQWSPIPAGTSFRMIGLEVTQGVQLLVSQGVVTSSSFVPLVAATTNSFKRTFVRVYLGVSGASRVTGVSGRLTASRPDGSLPGGPATVQSLNSITVDASATQLSARASLATSLNFELPREWLGPGELHLQLDHLEIEGSQSALPCIDCDNPGIVGLPGQAPAGPALVRFHTVPPARIWLVGVPYMAGTKLVQPRQLDFDMLASWLRRTYPTADVQVTQASMAALSSPPSSCDAVNRALSDWAALLPAQDARTRYYGLIPDNGTNNFVGGCSEIGGHFGSGPAGPLFPETTPWDLDGSYTDAYGGHEIAHMYDRRHPGFCANQETGDPSYPYLNGSIGGYLGSSVVEVQGLDAGDASLGLPMTLNDWRSGWHDVMTYCPNQWMSDYTFRGILHNLCTEDGANCPDRAALFGARARPSDTDRVRARGLSVSITGSLKLSNEKLTLGPLWARNGLTPTVPEADGAYAIELRGAGGKVLARHRFDPKEQSDPAGPGTAQAVVNEVVPFPGKTKQIVITHGARILSTVRVSAHAPKVRLRSPGGGKTLSEQVTVRWKSSDADGNRRWYTVLYTPDGERFVPVASGLTRTSLRVDLTTLPGGTRARFEVIASDGVRTGSARSGRPLNVPVKAPRVSILAPQDDVELEEDQTVTLVGGATDLQDGQLQASQLVWQSSLQGLLGTGPSLTVALRPGTHVIKLTGTNRAGRSSAVEITVIVHPAPPVVVAEIVP